MINLDQFLHQYPRPESVGLDRLYRFYKFEEQYLKSLFIDGLFHFTAPADFNDPFEARPNFDMTKINAALVRKNSEALLRKMGKLSYKDAERIVAEHMRNPDEFSKMMSQVAYESFQACRIACFSARYDNILMWSHYAVSHEGYCIGVDANFLSKLPTYRVNYTDDYPHVHYPLPADERCHIEILSKSADWSYEEEYRCIFPADGYQEKAPLKWINNCIEFPLEVITDVYLGNRMSHDNKEKIIDVIRASGRKLNIWQAGLHSSQYKLIFTPINY